MGADTKIEWARHTHNPWIGCTAVSPACDNCYAEALGKRFGVAWGAAKPRRRTSEANRRKPFAWNRAAAKAGRVDSVFCASLADIWDNQAPIEWLVEELDTIRLTLHLRWLLLTKRPQMIRRRLEHAKEQAASVGNHALQVWIERWLDGRPPANVWLGATVENQAEANRRIPHLLAVPAARRFLSCEPLLGTVDLNTIAPTYLDGELTSFIASIPDADGAFPGKHYIDWVIAGGESGPKARASHPGWFRSMRDQCVAAQVPFFFKQWGEWRPAEPKDDAAPFPNGWRALRGHPHVARAEELYPEAGAAFVAKFGKKAAGATLDGREWREVPGD